MFDTHAIPDFAKTPPRRAARLEGVAFAIRPCWLGALLAAVGEQGVCAIFFGDDSAEMLAAQRARLPFAEPAERDARFDDSFARIGAFVDAPATSLDLPLDSRGTPFQESVWAALREIPPGATATYAEIAQRIGAPKASSQPHFPLPYGLSSSAVAAGSGSAARETAS